MQLDYEDLIVPEHLIGPSFSEETILHTLILFPKANGNYVPYILKIYPDDAERKFKLADFLAGGYQKIPADFSGKYLFYKWNEKLIGGWRIKAGEKVKRIKPVKKDNQKTSQENSKVLLESVCYEVTYTEYQVTCQEGFGCSDRQVLDRYVTMECEYYETTPPVLDDEGWGGGGGTTPPEADPCEVPDGNIIDLPVDCEEEEDKAIAYLENVFRTINDCEKEVVVSNLHRFNSIIQIFNNSVWAEEHTKGLFSPIILDTWNNCGDAFRHAYWNALNVITVPLDLAILLATAHECSGYNDLEKNMDLHNNSIGREIGSKNLNLSINNFNDNQILIEEILSSLRNGGLKIIFPRREDNGITRNSEIISSYGFCN